MMDPRIEPVKSSIASQTSMQLDSSRSTGQMRISQARWWRGPEAFNEGLAVTLQTTGSGFIVKLDGDLDFPPSYFANSFEEFRLDPKLGIGGGIIFHDLGNGKETIEQGSPIPRARRHEDLQAGLLREGDRWALGRAGLGHN